MKKAHKKTAFTLVELMMTIAIGAILILTVAAVLIMIYRSWNTNNAYVRLRRDAAYAIEFMTRDIHESKSADFDTDTPKQLIVYDPDNIKGYTVTYTLNGTNGVLSCDQDPGPDFTVATRVDQFIPVETNNGVQITLVMENTDFDIVITNKTFIRVRN